MLTSIDNVVLKNISLSTIMGRTYNNCTFESSVEFHTSLQFVTFNNCNFHRPTFNPKTILKNVSFINCIFVIPPDFSECVLDNVVYDKTNISNVKFISASLLNMKFSSMNLSNSNFTNAKLNFVSITNTNLSNAILTNISATNLIGTTSQLPSSWKIVVSTIQTNNVSVGPSTISTLRNNILIGPTANMSQIIMHNVNLDHMNLYGVNFSNATLKDISVDGTILEEAVFRNVISSNIKGTPKSFPIGTTIYNNQFYYTQDDINLPNSLSLTPSKTTTNLISPSTLSITNKNLIYSGIIQNSDQHLLVYLSQNYVNPYSFEGNTIYIYEIDKDYILSTIQIPNFFITSITPQSTTYGKGAMLVGYGYHISVLQPLKYIIIRLDPFGQLDTLYEGTGYKIQEIDNQLYPSGYTEMIMNSSELFYLTQSNLNRMVISKMKFNYSIDCSGINFSGKNLSGTDLSGRNFTNCDFSGTNLSYCNFTNSNFTNANFYKTNLSYSILSNVILTDVKFIQPNFTGIYLSSDSVNFTLPNGFKFVKEYFIGPGLNLDGMDLSGVNLSNVNLQGSSLRNAILTNTKVWGTNFQNCILDNVTSGGITGVPIFSSSGKYKLFNGFIVGPYLNLRKANLSRLDLTNMNLFGAHMSEADLSACIFNNVKSGNIQGMPITSSNVKIVNGYILATGTLLDNADLSGGELNDIDISGTLLTNANFYNVKSGNISGTPILSSSYDIRNGYLVGPYVNMSAKDLSGVDLTNVSLYGANVDGTDLRYTNLTNLSSGNLYGTPLLDSKYKLLNGYIIGPKTDLSGANLSHLDISRMDLEGTNLQNGIFTNLRSGSIKGIPILSNDYRFMNGYIVGREVDLSGANLEWQDFSDLDLFGTNFTRANLKHSTFNRTFIFDTNFTDIEYEDIRSSDLKGSPSHLPSGLIIIDGYIKDKPSKLFIGPWIKLENIEFRNQNMMNIDLNNSQLINIYFNDVNLESVNFHFTKLMGIRSKNVSGTPINLSSEWKIINGYLIGPNANLMYADFTNLDLSGTNLSDANLIQVKFMNTIPGSITGIPILGYDWKIFQLQSRDYIIGPGMNLSKLNLSGQNLTNMNLSNTNIDQTIFTHATLKNVSSGRIRGTTNYLPESWKLINGYLIGPHANLSKAELERSNLENTILTHANLVGANLNNTNLLGSKLDGVISGNIRGIPILPVGWRCINGYLIGPQANVSNVDLSGVDLSGMDLSGCNLSGANLTHANLTHANLTHVNFLGANLTNIQPVSIYEQIDLTGVILPSNNYLQYNYFVSRNIRTKDFLNMKYGELKAKVYQILFTPNNDIRKNISLSLIKRFNLKLYRELYIIYSESSNGIKDENYFDTLNLLDVDIRFQIYQRTLTLINNMTYVDEFLLRLVNRFDVDNAPENILRNINFELVLPETVSMFYMKHLFNSRFHSMILSQPKILEKVEKFFRQTSKIYDDNIFVQNLYGVTNNSNHPSYLNIVKQYRYQTEVFENYLYSQDIADKYTNASKIGTMFRKMIDLNNKYITPVIIDLYKKIITSIFGPLSRRDDFDLYKLNENRLFVSFEFEKHLVTEFIAKNTSLVQSMFIINTQLSQFWDELKQSHPDLFVLKRIYSWINTLEDAIVYFRMQLFKNIKEMTYTYVYPTDITETVLKMREDKLDGMVNMSDENIDVVSEYFKNNSYVQRILQEPQNFIKDIESSSFSSVTDITKLYGFSLYTTPEMKEKIIKYDIRLKLEQDELRYVELLSGIRSDIRGDENLVAPLEEYRRIWKLIIS